MTLTYCKGLPTPIDELNAIGKTQLEMFLGAYTPIFHKAVCETVNLMLSGEDFNNRNGTPTSKKLTALVNVMLMV
jgi:hypothetical protein